MAAPKQLWVLMLTVFVDMVSFLMVLPLLPFYADRMGASEATVGLLFAVFALAQLTTAPLWGRLSDRVGRRPVILTGLTVTALSLVVFGLAESVLLLFVSRIIQGVGAGTIGVVQAYVTDAVEPSGRAQAIGWLTAAASAGVTVGPAVGSFAIRLGSEAPGFLAAGFCVLNLASAWRWLPEPASHASPDRPRQSVVRAIHQVLFHPRSDVASLIWIYTTGMMAFMAMNGVIALYLNRTFQITEESIGWFYVYVGAVSVVMRALLLGPIIHRLGEVRTLRLGALSILVGLAVIPLPGHVLGMAAAVLFVPVGTALLFPATTSLVSQLSPPGETGQILGVQQTFGGVSRMLGPIWAASLFQYQSHSAPFWVGSALMILAVLLAMRVRSPEARPEVDHDAYLETEASTRRNL